MVQELEAPDLRILKQSKPTKMQQISKSSRNELDIEKEKRIDLVHYNFDFLNLVKEFWPMH